MGFCGSATNMVRGPILEYAEAQITNSEWMRGFVDMDFVRAGIQNHRNGLNDYGMQIWTLLNLSMWHKIWIEGREIDEDYDRAH